MNKYFKLYQQIKEEIISGAYLAGEKLPSKRITADRHGVSVITVEKAYYMLYEEGYITSEEKKGYFVSPIESLRKTKEVDFFPHLERVVDEPVLSTSDFEHSVWIKTVRKVMTEQGKKLFIKSPNKGVGILRNALSDYLYRYRKMPISPKNIIIGSGAEQLYESAVKVLGRDKIYGIESPCYHMIKSVYNGLGVKTIPLKMGKDGIETNELKKNFFVLHVTPFNSFPSNITASASKRHEYLSVIKKKGGYIIEDDFASEFFKPGNPIDSLFSLSGEDNVIYINTFSKSLSPSMRMGYMILPNHLLEIYDKVLGEFSCSVPVMVQYVLAEFINNGGFERHLNRVRRKLNK